MLKNIRARPSAQRLLEGAHVASSLKSHGELGGGILVAAMVIVGVIVVSRYRRFVASGRVLRPLPPRNARFIDLGAKAQLDGAGAGFGMRDTYLWVTEYELVIETPFPYNLMGLALGEPLSERAPLANIKTVAVLDRHIARVSFTSLDGDTRTISLDVRDSSLLEAALRR